LYSSRRFPYPPQVSKTTIFKEKYEKAKLEFLRSGGMDILFGCFYRSILNKYPLIVEVILHTAQYGSLMLLYQSSTCFSLIKEKA